MASAGSLAAWAWAAVNSASSSHAVGVGLLGEPLPGLALGFGAGGALLGGQAAVGLGLGRRLRLRRHALMRRLPLGEFTAQPLQFGLQGGAFGARVGWRDERAGREGAVAGDGPVEPDPQRPGVLQAGQRHPMITVEIVRGVVPGLAEDVEQVADLAGQHAAITQAAQQVGLLFLGGGPHSKLGRRQLRQKFGELPGLDDGGVRILGEEALGQGTQSFELDIMPRQEPEIERTRQKNSPVGRKFYTRVRPLSSGSITLGLGKSCP